MLVTLHALQCRWKLRRCAPSGHAPKVEGWVWVHGPGTVKLGKDVVFDASAAPIELKTLTPEAVLEIGDGARICSGTSIEAVLSVSIGAFAVLGAFSKVMDNHFHPLVGDRHQRPESAPVIIGRGAKIGERAIVLPASRVGENAIVRPGTLVTRRTQVADNAIVRGNPAVPE